MTERIVMEEYKENELIEYRIEEEDTEQQQQRIKWGISARDSWNLDSYLTVVFANGLKMLADNLHSYPSEYEEKYGNNGFEEWKKEILRIHSLFVWLMNYDKYSLDVYRSFYSQEEDRFYFEEIPGSTHKLIVDKNPDEEKKNKWIKLDRELYQRKQEIKDYVMDWIKENFFGLWD